MNSLLTIGQLSKLSGIHVKALRYYESINILKPTIVNTENGYRYYNISTISYVKVIKICADYGIPLKEFANFINENQQIHIKEILDKAQSKISERERLIRRDKQYLNQLLNQLKMSTQLDSTSLYHIKTRDEDYLISPFDQSILSEDYYRASRDLLISLEEQGLYYDKRVGIYLRKEKEIWKQFVACKVLHTQHSPNISSNIICLNKSHIHAEHVTPNNITSKLLQLEQENNITEALILETFEEPYNFETPHLEIRYFLQ
ncbi:MerR family DNA-binding transcriptional regulator [Streptococcus dysgalactiae]|uniref:MerR family DNA-binding transcriptional regulator n=1 Tax=Streptococcus dysgalactiae TaxID=1334 RepID=UPI0010CAB24B|nr:MerR family DNA-binding transcriptional regulator [Streptococcus dysgalactiae]VTT02061.1 transcriptional regulator [Streptococcus dysgalactiae]